MQRTILGLPLFTPGHSQHVSSTIDVGGLGDLIAHCVQPGLNGNIWWGLKVSRTMVPPSQEYVKHRSMAYLRSFSNMLIQVL